MINDFAKGYLHEDLRWVRQSVLDKLDGLSEYDVRRPLTRTGTNLLGLIKHLTLSEAVYLGDLFNRPFPEWHPRLDDPGYRNRDWLWATENQSRADIVNGYRAGSSGRRNTRSLELRDVGTEEASSAWARRAVDGRAGAIPSVDGPGTE